LQAFTVIAYGLFPLFLSRMLNAFSEITPWVSWLLGILLSIAVMYHGVPRVMQPDPAHAFGLYMSTALLLVLSTGLLELVVAFFLQGSWASSSDLFLLLPRDCLFNHPAVALQRVLRPSLVCFR